MPSVHHQHRAKNMNENNMYKVGDLYECTRRFKREIYCGKDIWSDVLRSTTCSEPGDMILITSFTNEDETKTGNYYNYENVTQGWNGSFTLKSLLGNPNNNWMKLVCSHE